ncbi:serine/threonine-protein kinase [Patulibacter minatonensis]|uniref:serine/threonine-protein kinase n=1 Tax=Patulibacter minatonensis TaxID=298163 RepID=UPI0004BCBBDD|nr:serine/threonine-protein kinase [Patulibacter minatonensis]
MSAWDLEPGARFDDHYVVEAVAGRGGMGVVYRAHDEELDRTVALKVAAERLSDLPELQEGLRREARLAASIDHPSVVAVHHVGVVDGRPYVALQWVEGSDLRHRLAGGPPSVPDAVRILEQLASGLDAAHEAGCLHRDVKPANVLVRDDADGPRASLTDFGVAGALHDAGRWGRGDATTEIVGTPAYLAPELVQGESGDARSDLYGLACVAFETLTGTPPFSAPTVPAMLVAHAIRDRPSASERRPELPAAVDEVLARGMAIDPADRPRDGAELIAGLHRALGLAPGGRPAPGPRAALRRFLGSLESRPGLRRGLATASVLAVAVLAGGAGAAAHELLTDPPVSHERDLARADRAPAQPAASGFSKRGVPAGREDRDEVAGLFADYAALNRAPDIKAFFHFGDLGTGFDLYGRGERCPAGNTLPEGLVLPKGKNVALSKGPEAVQKWLWQTKRAPVRLVGLSPASLRTIDTRDGGQLLQWGGQAVDGEGRRRELRLVASRFKPQYPWSILLFDFCPRTRSGA